MFDRFGVGEWDWAEFTPRMKQKTYEEIKKYAMLIFLFSLSDDYNNPYSDCCIFSIMLE